MTGFQVNTVTHTPSTSTRVALGAEGFVHVRVEVVRRSEVAPVRTEMGHGNDRANDPEDPLIHLDQETKGVWSQFKKAKS